MTATKILCDFLLDTAYNDIPRDVIKIAKERILDTVGVMLAGAIEPAGAGRIAVELVKELGGTPTSAVIAGGFKTSAPNASLANGTSAATMEYDDTSTFTVCHYSGALVPAVLAVAEETKASGKKLLESFVLAWEIGTRIGACLGGAYFFKRGFHPVGTWPCLGCASATAKLLNCDLDQTRKSLGIAASAAGSIRRAYGTNTKPLHSGQAARNGIIAAMLAKKGFTAHKDILDDDPEAPPNTHLSFSFPVAFSGEGNYNLSKLTEGLGRSYNLVTQPVTTSFYPGAYATAVFIELVINMMSKNSLAASDIEKVEVWGTRDWINGMATFSRPKTGDEARFSGNYQIAVAILDGRVGIEQHREERVHSPDVQEMMQRIYISELKGSESSSQFIHETGNVTRSGLGELTIKLKDGREFTGKGKQPRGSGELPLNYQDLLNKYEDCANRVLSPSDVERSVELIENLDDVADITELMDILKTKGYIN